MIACEFEDGAKASLRHVVVDALIINDNKILLVKRAPHLTHGNKYGLPGGFLNRDETTRNAIEREILEETGYTAKNIRLFRIVDRPNRYEDRQNVAFIFLTEAGEQVGKPDNEVSEVVWMDLAHLPAKETFAFDHHEHIERFLAYQKSRFPLPILD